MIVKILSSGKSFKGLATYLTRDPEAKTDERVGWTHTLNLAHDDALSAVDEMLWTSRYAELLKQEAGIRAGGRATENPVKHLSLNWSPDDHPTHAHMIEATREFLRHMKWDEHQALLVAHEDKAHSHVHVMLNVIHPETGLRLDDGFERRRAQAWALEYEREQGNIRCENRLRDFGEREDAPTRPAWMAFQGQQKSFEENEKNLSAQNLIFEIEPENQGTREAREWESLKKMQRDERLGFFAEGKQAFSELRLSIYQDVRDEFRPQWADYYAVQKNGGDADALKELKASLVAEQKAVLEERRDEACAGLREFRNGVYQELLEGQRDMRLGLHERQDAGLTSLDLIDLFKVEVPEYTNDIMLALRGAERETTAKRAEEERPAEIEEQPTIGREESGNMRAPTTVGADIASDIGFGILSIFGGIADGLIGAGPPPKPKRVEPERQNDLFAFAAEDARKRSNQEREKAEEREDEERRARSRQ